eukprot:CAMPEP_0206622358 /NCGR_PEP_ID=MMETSP0325_2-20121206/62750_1 /ASSEMBLY_ACC=CAM_ASM_000347 /TAXON_ID=2866 /ORGANISM="Crypthecodinium cohnii, Strain Seligo" /LENGTH=72 /DNA_ID=CAMNT_0054145651 /DNA_START=38 /DNA_END=252 /DNA_ORIENTATION=-
MKLLPDDLFSSSASLLGEGGDPPTWDKIVNLAWPQRSLKTAFSGLDDINHLSSVKAGSRPAVARKATAGLST